MSNKYNEKVIGDPVADMMHAAGWTWQDDKPHAR